MDIYDNDLNNLGKIPEEYNDLFHEQAYFLSNLTGNNDDINHLINNRMKNTMLISCSRVEGKGVMRPSMYNGKLQKFALKRGAGAEAGLAVQTSTPEGWDFKIGIFIREKAYDLKDRKTYEGTLPHEAFHAMSNNTNAKFDKNGICYTKSGFIITRYDRQDNEVSRIPATALTEGVTEMLANMFNNRVRPHSYTLPTYIARIMNESKHQPSLLEAYLSEDEKMVEQFLQNFNEKQTHSTSDDLLNLTLSENEWKNDQNLNLIYGSMQYTINSLTTIEELQNFYNYAKDITVHIAKEQRSNIVPSIRQNLIALLDARKEEILSTEAAKN